MDTAYEKDYLKRECPACGTIGTMRMDPISVTFRCTSCGRTNIDPYENHTRQRTSKKTQTETLEMDPRPPIPEDAKKEDIVEDFYRQPLKDGSTRRVLVSRVYCPRNYKADDSIFDPNTKEARFYLHAYAARFKNRRRYQRDRKKRAAEDNNQSTF